MIDAETPALGVERIQSTVSLRIVRVVERHILRERAEMGVVVQFSSGADRSEIVLFQPVAGGHQRALGLSRLFRDDVDDAVHGIRTPKGSARSSDDLHTFNVFQNDVDPIPEDPPEPHVVDRPTVDHHQHLVPDDLLEPAGGHRPGARPDSSNEHPGNHPEEIRQLLGPRPADVLRRDDENGRRRIEEMLLLLACGGDGHFEKVFQLELRDVRHRDGFFNRGGRRWRRFRDGFFLSRRGRQSEDQDRGQKSV